MLCTLLVISLPTDNATARMRAWRALKAAGAAVLRDGVYALPEGPAHRATLAAVAADVNASGGTARQLFSAESPEDLQSLFDREPAYGEWLNELAELRAELAAAVSPSAAPAGARAGERNQAREDRTKQRQENNGNRRFHGGISPSSY